MGLGQILSGSDAETPIRDGYGRMRPAINASDSISGHWEIAGVTGLEPFATLEKFPEELIEAIRKEAHTGFVVGCRPDDGRIPSGLLEKHFQSGYPILYAGAESSMEIAAHEEIIPRKQLYGICRIARRLCNSWRIAQVIAKPFSGTALSPADNGGRHVYQMVPPRTVLNAITEKGLVVEGVGKISDLFAHSGITHSHRAHSNRKGMVTIENLWDTLHEGLIFANLPEFDQYGHQRDLHGFANALIEFDSWLGGFLPKIEPEDLLIITADHGNDPTFRGNGHTREEVPLIALCGGRSGPLGVRETFADVAATLAVYFGLDEPWPVGKSFLPPSWKRQRPFHLQK